MEYYSLTFCFCFKWWLLNGIVLSFFLTLHRYRAIFWYSAGCARFKSLSISHCSSTNFFLQCSVLDSNAALVFFLPVWPREIIINSSINCSHAQYNSFFIFVLKRRYHRLNLWVVAFYSFIMKRVHHFELILHFP